MTTKNIYRNTTFEVLEVDPRTNASVLEDKFNTLGLTSTLLRNTRPFFWLRSKHGESKARSGKPKR